MHYARKPKIRLITLYAALCLSFASYLALQVFENRQMQAVEQEMMAEEILYDDVLPDVQLIKQLMNKTIEFILLTPRMDL